MHPQTTKELGNEVKKENGNMEDASVDELCDALCDIGMYGAKTMLKDGELEPELLAKDYDEVHFAIRQLLKKGKLNYNDLAEELKWARSI